MAEGAGILEKDKNGDTLWTWSFPEISEELKGIVGRKTKLEETEVQFVYGNFKNTWYYIYTTPVAALSDGGAVGGNMAEVVSFAIVILGKDFGPEKYREMAVIFSNLYAKEGKGASLLASFLGLSVRGTTAGSGTAAFSLDSYPIRKAYLNTSVADIINLFGMEVILIYVALLLKKRVIVYCPDVQSLLRITRTLPQLVYHRQDWNILRPYIDMSEEELADLSKQPYFIAGCPSSDISLREDLYDLFINVPEVSISVATHANNTFNLGKVHKEIAFFFNDRCK